MPLLVVFDPPFSGLRNRDRGAIRSSGVCDDGRSTGTKYVGQGKARFGNEERGAERPGNGMLSGAEHGWGADMPGEA